MFLTPVPTQTFHISITVDEAYEELRRANIELDKNSNLLTQSSHKDAKTTFEWTYNASTCDYLEHLRYIWDREDEDEAKAKESLRDMEMAEYRKTKTDDFIKTPHRD